MQWEITAKCNNNCIHCYNYWREEDQNYSHSFTLPELISIADQIIKNHIFDVTLTGGEPLLFWKHLPFVIGKLISAGVDVNLNSNLTLLTSVVAQRLKKAGLRSILVSVLANKEEVHDCIANRQGAWKQTVNGIKIAVANNFTVSANMVLLRQNYNLLYETAAFLQQLGIKTFSATKASPALNRRNFDRLRLNKKQLQESLELLVKIKNELGMNVDILECYPLCLIGDVKKFSHFARRSCTAGVTTCTVGSTGEVRPCSHADMSYGNILEENLSPIWKHMTDWREGKYIPEECHICKFLQMCSGGCRMEAKYLGSICGKDPYMTSANDVIFNSNTPKVYRSTNLCQNDEEYILQSDCKFRQEIFGAIVKNKTTGAFLVNTDGYNILKKISSQKSFSIERIAREFDIFPANVKKFLAPLINKRVINSVKSRVAQNSAKINNR